MSKSEELELQKAAWLRSHLPYELAMARYSFDKLTRPGFMHFMDWNCYHSAFAVAAGNLAAFLTNAEKERINFQASNFAPDFRARKGDLASTFQKMEPTVFHLGKERQDDHGKFDIEDIKKIMPWIEAEMAKFLATLPPDLQPLWNEKLSQPATLVLTVLSTQTASSADPQVATTTLVIGKN